MKGLTESTEWRLLSARKARYAVTLSCLYQVWELSAFDLILSHSQKPNDHPSFKALLWCMACLFIPVICECTWSFGITAQFDTSAVKFFFFPSSTPKNLLGVLAPLPRIIPKFIVHFGIEPGSRPALRTLVLFSL